MDYNSKSIKPYIKSHQELQRKITIIELAPSPYFFVQSICLACLQGLIKIQQWLLKILRKQNVSDGRTDGRTNNVKTVYPPQRKFAVGITIAFTKLIGSYKTPKKSNYRRLGPYVIKLFSCSTQQSMEFILLINVKMPTSVGILTFISIINTTTEIFKA